MYNFNSTPFYEPLNGGNYVNNGSNVFSNLTLHSVHLSPEELAAIDHGLMSVYGKQSSTVSASAGSGGNEKENNNLGFNTPAAGTTSKPNNYYGYNTPTPTPMIFTDPKTQNQQNQNQNQNFYNRTPAAQTSAPIHNYTPQNQNFTPFSNQTPKIFDDNLIKSYEERIEGILRQEREKYEAMESNYRQQLEQLKRNEFGYSEKLKLEQIIQDLRRQIDNLERQLSESKRFSSSASSSATSNTDFDKIEALKLHYDRKIANLVGQFEQEKASALEIMKTRAKAEINLIIPKLKSQLQANLERNQTEIVNKVKGQAQAYIQKLKQDFQMERQVLIEHLRRKHFEEIKQIKNQLQIKFEMRLNEEREKLQKTKTYNSSRSSSTNSRSYNNNYYDTNNYGNNNAFSYGNGLFGDEPSFLL